jgi:long-chain acyl-CoA synthetase
VPVIRSHLASLVDDFARLGSETAIVAFQGLRERRTSYGQLALSSRAVAGELERRGIVKGDRVVIWGANSAEWVAAFFGCVLQGILPVPVDLASNPEFVGRIIGEVAPKLVLADRDKFPNVPV